MMAIEINGEEFAYIACGVWVNKMQTMIINEYGDMVLIENMEWVEFIIKGYYD